jgi:2,3-bisphosphoglycerate-independent phosphoglycerate mutase
MEGGQPLVRKDDSVVFWNFRPDRARELSRAFVFPDFNDFDRGPEPPAVHFVTMTEYDETFPSPVAFPHTEIKHTLAEILSGAGLKQLHVAETEKYAHVTFFFNGGEETPVAGEDRVLIPSPHVATYDLKPEMSAFEVTDALVEKVAGGGYDFIVINYANADMVGHTAVKPAIIKAVEAVDACLGRVITAVRAAGGVTIITADHGNADQIANGEGKPVTAHTTNRVPFILVEEGERCLREDGILADIAPTILNLLGLDKPAEMTGSPLVC